VKEYRATGRGGGLAEVEVGKLRARTEQRRLAVGQIADAARATPHLGESSSSSFFSGAGIAMGLETPSDVIELLARLGRTTSGLNAEAS
jgi:hypothetical protein